MTDTFSNTKEDTKQEKKADIITNSLWRVWDDTPPIKIPKTEYTLKGFSIAALRTNFYIKELGVMFDAGISSGFSPDYIFVTHTHSDHSANLPFHLYGSRTDISESKSEVFVPEPSFKKFVNLIETNYALGTGADEDNRTINKICDLHPVKPHDMFTRYIKNKEFIIEVIECFHTVPCVGYGLIERRKKLQDKYLGLPGKEIKELLTNNVDIYKTVDYPVFCYIGDTSAKVLDAKTLEKYGTIMIECSFIHDNELDRAKETCHMHWKHLESFVKSHQDITFILYHFSQRYKRNEIKTFFDNLKLKNVIPWISN